MLVVCGKVCLCRWQDRPYRDPYSPFPPILSCRRCCVVVVVQVRERNSILFYSLYWGLTGLLYLVALLDEHKSAKGQFASSSHVAVAFTFLFMSKAIVSLLVRVCGWLRADLFL